MLLSTFVYRAYGLVGDRFLGSMVKYNLMLLSEGEEKLVINGKIIHFTSKCTFMDFF